MVGSETYDWMMQTLSFEEEDCEIIGEKLVKAGHLINATERGECNRGSTLTFPVS